MNSYIKSILNHNLKKDFFQGNWGLEVESLRVNKEGELSVTPHPEELGDKLNHPYITTDFSESQVEFITPALPDIQKTHHFLENLYDIVNDALKEEEYLWPNSMPPILPSDEEIPIADFGNSPQGDNNNLYRQRIARRYGKKKQMISGIHYNFSFSSDFLKKLHRAGGEKESFREFKNTVYMKISRNLLKNRWFLTYLLGANVGVHRSYTQECENIVIPEGSDSFILPEACSFRNSTCGYRNNEEFRVRFDTLDNYLEDLKALIDKGKIEDCREYYSPVRLKNPNKGDTLTVLKEQGIEYLELRFIDFNPLHPTGISLEDLHFIHLFILFALLSEDDSYTLKDQEISEIRQNRICLNGRGRIDDLKKEALDFLTGLESLLKSLEAEDTFYGNILSNLKDKVNYPELLPSSIIYNEIMKGSYIDFHMEIARRNKKNFLNNAFTFKGEEELELSTQILLKESLKRGLSYRLLDKKENFISLTKGNKTEYIKQATKTSLDTYSSVLVMENKAVTKQVLLEKNLPVPRGEIYTFQEEACSHYGMYRGRKIVVKPNTTNFGLGITILDKDFTEEDYIFAVKNSFSYDSTVLIEHFYEGNEYRFLVIKGEVAGILQRVPANVTGDGKRTISELIDKKNENPLRGTGYVKPLEKLKKGADEELFLKLQGLDFNYVPKEGETVYLRKNSNISTGGDSLDFTDEISDFHKDIAVKATEAVGAVISGVDMIISEEDHCILEMNFNPAIHIHSYPARGKNRKIAEKLLKALGF